METKWSERVRVEVCPPVLMPGFYLTDVCGLFFIHLFICLFCFVCRGQHQEQRGLSCSQMSYRAALGYRDKVLQTTAVTVPHYPPHVVLLERRHFVSACVNIQSCGVSSDRSALHLVMI